MNKIVLSLFLSMFLFASDVVVFGSSSYTNKNLLTIQNATLIKQGIRISAKTIIYNKTTKIATAIGDVYINYENNDDVIAKQAKIDLKTNEVFASPLFLFDLKDNGWITSKHVKAKKDIYLAKASVASTCVVDKPDWKLSSTSLKYNKTTKWIDLYNPVLYIKDVPILYLPYLSFSLNKTRTSGFLTPVFGYSANEGALFTFPYYQTLTPA